MIISENGAVVGKLDNVTLALSDVKSEKLQQLVDEWRRDGFEMLGPAEYLGDGPKPDCATAIYVIPFETDSLYVIANQLLIAGFEVQVDS